VADQLVRSDRDEAGREAALGHERLLGAGEILRTARVTSTSSVKSK
jgi:hypothetical protein